MANDFSPALVSIVIPAFNEEKLIGPCLTALTNLTTTHPFEVILVDNASTDRTVPIARTFAKQLPLHIVHEPVKGRGAARATGCAAAKGEIIFSTDADSVVPPDWLELILPHFTDPQVVAVTSWGRTTDFSWWKNGILNLVFRYLFIFHPLIIGAYWLSGFNAAIRANAYRAVGGFSEQENGMEDLELTKKIMHLGTIKLVPEAVVEYSGRRFEQGLIRGALDYIRAATNRYLRPEANHHLKDVV